MLKENNINPQAIELKKLFPILNYSSLEENKNLQDKWANLLTNALDPNRSKYIMPIYAEILKDLTPIEVKILDSLYKEITKRPIEEQKRSTFYTDKKEIIAEHDYLTEEEFDIYLDNLIRLNLCTYRPIEGFILGPRINNTIKLTKLGISFIKSCQR